MIKTYRKKPMEVQALQFTGDNFAECYEFLGRPKLAQGSEIDDVLRIVTLEGVMCCSKGDYIIRGVHGEYYPCKPDIFHQTYEEVEV